MAIDPNFSLRTHQRIFTGPNKHPDKSMQQAAWESVPKCIDCDSAVFFKGNKAMHYDQALNMDLKPMEKSEQLNIARRLDADHEPITTDRPDNHIIGLTLPWTPELAQTRHLGRQFLDDNGLLKPFAER